MHTWPWWDSLEIKKLTSQKPKTGNPHHNIPIRNKIGHCRGKIKTSRNITHTHIHKDHQQIGMEHLMLLNESKMMVALFKAVV